MAKKKQKKKRKAAAKSPAPRQKDFLDMIAPAAVRFNTDYYIFGNTYRCAFAVKGYPPTTEDLALLYRLSEMSGVNIRLTARKLADGEEDAIIQASSQYYPNYGTLKKSFQHSAARESAKTPFPRIRRNPC